MVVFSGYYIYERPTNILEGLTNQPLIENLTSQTSNSRNSSFYYSYIEGDNLVHDHESSYMAEENGKLRNQDELFTAGNAKATLTFINDSKITLGDSSKLKIVQLPRSKNSGLYVFKLLKGKIMMDFSDELSKFAVKFIVDDVEIYTRKSTIFLEKSRDRLKVAVDYGAAKYTIDGNSNFLAEGEGKVFQNGYITNNETDWLEKITWDDYFHDLNRNGRKGPFKLQRPKLSTRKIKRKRRNGQMNFDRVVAKKSTREEKTEKKLEIKNSKKLLDEAINKSGGKLLEKLPIYGNKIKEVKNQINMNTDAINERNKVIEDLEQ